MTPEHMQAAQDALGYFGVRLIGGVAVVVLVVWLIGAIDNHIPRYRPADDDQARANMTERSLAGDDNDG